MMMRTRSLTLSPRTVRLAVTGCAVALVFYAVLSMALAGLDAKDQIADLGSSYATIIDQRAVTTRLGSLGLASRSQQTLIASGKEAAISLIQHSLQQSVEPPAKLESLHILDAPDEKGLIVVRASIRIRNLAPERVAAFVGRIEETTPAIIFDDLRISIQTKPGVFGSAGFGSGAETNTADISGVVRTYAMTTTDRLPSETGMGQP